MKLSQLFKDKQGKTVIVQWPNWPLWVALALFLLHYYPNTIVQNFSFWGLILTLFYWSYLEICFGVNTWRKILGILVLSSQIYKIYQFFI
jgi:hypothetical protein